MYVVEENKRSRPGRPWGKRKRAKGSELEKGKVRRAGSRGPSGVSKILNKAWNTNSMLNSHTLKVLYIS